MHHIVSLVEQDSAHIDSSGNPTTAVIRLKVHVHPGSKRHDVGGCYDGALVVHVRARALDGVATRDTLSALAAAFDVRPNDVVLVRGATSRTKIFEVRGDDEQLRARLNRLLAQ